VADPRATDGLTVLNPMQGEQQRPAQQVIGLITKPKR
jgi:hypothetical protein